MSTGQYSANQFGIPLREILPEAKTIGNQNVLIQSCCGKWDECQPNDLYVAVVGSEIDGHDYAVDAVKRGATAVVGERLLAIDRPQFIVDDSRKAYGKICHALAGNPSTRLRAIGVTGTDGKTVTSHLIHSILQAAGNETGICSSIESRLGKNFANQPLVSKPDVESSAPLLADRLTQMVMSGCDYGILETSSSQLAQHNCSGLQLDAAVITNVRSGNDALHGSTENYRRANLRLLSHLKTNGFVVMNNDDPASQQLLQGIETPSLTFGIHQKANVSAKLLESNQCFQTFVLNAGGESVPVRTSILGKQHIYNCLAAASVCLTFQLDLTTIARGLELAKIPGRLERVDCGQPYGLWIDSARTPTQFASAIAAVSKSASGKLWCIGSVDTTQSPQERKRLGHILEKATHRPIITASRISQQIDYEPFHQILDGFGDPSAAHLVPNRFRAIEYALSNAAQDDVVLITGCGDRPIATVGDNKWHLTDRDVCEAWLYDKASVDKSTSNSGIFHIDDYR